MKFLRIGVSAVFLVTACLFLVSFIRSRSADTTRPVIEIDTDLLTISLQAEDEELLSGVSAFDEKDGDLTDRIIVESISRFTEPGVAIVTYAVWDDDNHVASASRKIRYEDYTSPRFTMSDSLVFSGVEAPQVLDRVGAVDVIDGDISGKVVIAGTDYVSNTLGVYHISFKAFNSRGDRIYLELPLYIEDISVSAPTIELKEYLIYAKPGDILDVAANVKRAAAADGTDLSGSVQIDTDLDLTTPGTYQAHYYAADSLGRRAHTILTVIVGE